MAWPRCSMAEWKSCDSMNLRATSMWPLTEGISWSYKCRDKNGNAWPFHEENYNEHWLGTHTMATCHTTGLAFCSIYKHAIECTNLHHKIILGRFLQNVVERAWCLSKVDSRNIHVHKYLLYRYIVTNNGIHLNYCVFLHCSTGRLR